LELANEVLGKKDVEVRDLRRKNRMYETGENIDRMTKDELIKFK
jgi:hypothetical protein